MSDKIIVKGTTTSCNLNINSGVKPNYWLEFELSPEELAGQLTFEEAFQILYHNPNKKDLPQPQPQQVKSLKKYAMAELEKMVDTHNILPDGSVVLKPQQEFCEHPYKKYEQYCRICKQEIPNWRENIKPIHPEARLGGKMKELKEKIDAILFDLDRINHNAVTEMQSLAIVAAMEILKYNKGKFVIWKDGTWLYIKNGQSYDYEQDKNWLLTIDLSNTDTYMEVKK